MQGASFGRLWVSSFWLLAFVLAFLVRSSYGYGAAALAIAGIVALLTYKQLPALSQATRRWVMVLLSYVAIMVIIFLLTDEALKSYERISRYLLAIPLVIAIWRWRPSYQWYVASVCLGAVIAFAVVFYARMVKGASSGGNFGYQMSIQFSDMTMLFGVATLLSSFAYQRLSARWWLLHICTALAISGAFLAGGRGSWLVLAPTMMIYIAATESAYRLKTAFLMLMVVVAIVLALYFIPQTQVSVRVAQVIADLKQFQIGNAFSSQGGRLEMWRCSVQLFQQQPWLGTGSALEQLMTAAAEQGLCDAAVKGYGHVHNDFLDIFVRYGLFGGFATLLMYLTPACLYLRALRLPLSQQQRVIAWSGLAVCLGFYTCSLTNAILVHNITSIFFLLFNAWFITGIGKNPVPVGKYV